MLTAASSSMCSPIMQKLIRSLIMNNSYSFSLLTLHYKLSVMLWYGWTHSILYKTSCIATLLLKSTVETNLPHPKRRWRENTCFFFLLKSSVPHSLGHRKFNSQLYLHLKRGLKPCYSREFNQKTMTIFQAGICSLCITLICNWSIWNSLNKE